MASENIINGSTKPKNNFGGFVQETQREIGKVTWPTRNEIFATTGMIVVLAVVAGVFFLMIDTGLGYVVSRILGMNGA